MKRTKIICTIGPKTQSEKMLTKLLNSGMDIIRLNFSHGNYLEHKKRIFNLRNVLKNTKYKAAILVDTKGPEIRTMKLFNRKDVFLKKNNFFTFTSNKNFIGNEKKVSVTYKNFYKDIQVNNIILVDDGLIEMKVLKIENKEVICKILNSGFLGENKGINIPGISIKLPTLSEKDKKDLIFACKQKVDFCAASFIRTSLDVIEIRDFLNSHNGKNIKIISKIENQEGLTNLDEILKVSDGIMVARGDLGVEIPIEDVIFAQKKIIKKCNFSNKFVITATHMLESMVKNPRPTRAESSDIANAIIDGTDAVMLSAETAKGKYPIKAVKIMSEICKKTDLYLIKKQNLNFLKTLETKFCKYPMLFSEKFKFSPLIVVQTETGSIATKVRKYYPNSIVLAITKNKKTAFQLKISKGIFPYLTKKINNIKNFYLLGKEIAISEKYAKKGDKIIMISKTKNSNIISITIHSI